MVVLDAPAGQIRARAEIRREGDRTRVERVSFVNVPSFTLCAAVPVRLGGREIRADVAFGGAFYAIVDAESAGMAVRPEHLNELRRAGMAIKHAVEAAVPVVHPLEPELRGIYGTIFTGPPSSEDAHLRNVTIFAEGRGRSIAVRDGHVRGDGRARGHGSARRRRDLRAREHHRHAGFAAG